MDYRKNPKGEIKTTYTYNYVTGHFIELLSYQIESYRIRDIEYLSNKNESYRIIMWKKMIHLWYGKFSTHI